MRILLAVDGSKYSQWATELLRRLPLAKAPRITVMHVVDLAALTHPALLSPSLALQYGRIMQREIRKNLAAADRLVARAAARLKRRWPAVRSLVVRGYVADRIMAQASKEGAELIIIGSRGLRNVRSFLLGSVSHKVVMQAPCPVLVVKRARTAVGRFLLAVDGSPSSDAAVRFVTTHLSPRQLGGTVLYVWDYPLPPRPEMLPVQMVDERYCDPLARSGFKTSPRVVMGHAAAVIVKAGRRLRADLTIVGARGLTTRRRFFLGGVSQKVVKYSHNAVLVVR